MYLEHNDKLENFDFTSLLQVRPDKTVRVIVPVIVDLEQYPAAHSQPRRSQPRPVSMGRAESRGG